MENSIGEILAKVQNSLKKEKVIETLTDARIKLLNQQLCENFDEILAKRKLYMFMLSYYQDFYTKTIDPIFFSSLFDDAKTLHPTKSSTPRNTLKHIRYFRENISVLSRTVIFLAGNRADLINILTYSTIPSIFQLLTRYSEQKLYLKFIEELNETNKIHQQEDKDKKELCILFARPIFLTPEFRIFVQAIADQISVQFCKIHGTALAEQFLSEFLVNAEKFIHLCPPIIGKIANKIYSSKLINESFFQEAIRNPLYFGFVQIGESENISEATSIVLYETATRSNFIEKLTNILLKSQKNSEKNAYSEIAKNISAYRGVYYATTYDAQLINVLASLAKVGDPAVPDDLPTEYGLNIFQDTVVVSPSQVDGLKLVDNKDPVIAAENALRSLLKTADPMPMIEHPHLSTFLKINLIDQIPSHLSQKQNAHFCILKSCRKQYQHNTGQKTTLEDFIKILIPNIKSHKKENTLASSEKLQDYTTSLTQMHYSKMKIIDFLTEKKFEISYIALTVCFSNHKIQASSKAFLSKSALISHFKDLENAWLSFAKQTHFNVDIPKEMLLITMLNLYTYENMMLIDYNLDKWDKLYNQYSSEDYDTNQDKKELDNLFKNEKHRFQHAIELICRAFKVQSTLLAMKLISASFESIKKVLNEVIGSFGMDELTSALFFVIYIARPPNFISKTEYFYRVFQTISEFKIDEYQEYIMNTIYLHQTAVYFFHNTKPNPLANDNFMNT